MRFRLTKVTSRGLTVTLCSFLLLISGSIARSQSEAAPKKFDEFGDMNAEDAMAYLDVFAVELSSKPDRQGVIVGRNRSDYERGWLLRKAYGYLDYLVSKRGIDLSQVKFVEGEPRRKVSFELWLVPNERSLPVAKRLPGPEPTSPERFDVISLGDEGQCVGQLFLHLYTLEDGLRFFGEALREQPRAKAWIVIHPSRSFSSAATNDTLNKSRSVLIKNYGVSAERIFSAIGRPHSSTCSDVNLWIAPAHSTKADEAAYYAGLMKEAEQTGYTVRRVEFSGNEHIRDMTLRRRLLPQEGEVFSRPALDQSLKNLNRLSLIYPVSLDDVEARLDREEKLIDLSIFFREKRRVRRSNSR
jgi:predicted nucleotidyltransferase